MKTLSNYIVEKAQARRGAPAKLKRAQSGINESRDGVQTISSLGFTAATVAFPANISLDERAERMNRFWETLAKYQYYDVLVVALCSKDS